MTQKKPSKKRIDLLLVDLGLETTRARAQARILAGDVVVDDHRIDKPGQLVAEDAAVRVKSNSNPFVSRGGIKLEAAIEQWPAPVEGAVCIDVGASTGGFTDVLLKRGAKSVFAVDVGYGQLAYALRQDPRVVVMERTHIVNTPLGTFVPVPTIAVVDVSFISLLRVLPGLGQHLAEKAFLYTLIKPQFEVGPERVEKGGIVRNVAAREEARDKVIVCAKSLGWTLVGVSESPIQGADGNVEYIAAFQK
jgi:23S rRNA (cytidine1920-2'-O)/16S rRNA (cytidine1409-2'-O)-methyltransferase